MHHSLATFVRRHIPRDWGAHGRRLAYLGFISYILLVSWQLSATLRTAPPPARVAYTQTAPPPERGFIAAGSHMFGIEAPAAASTAAPVAVMTAVHVIGLLSSGEGAVAILEVNGEQKAYSVGDRLPDGSTLASIEPDRVTLDQAGKRYSVLLDMPLADANAHFQTFDLGAGSLDDENDAQEGKPAPAEARQALQDLRKQILTRPRRKLDLRPAGLSPPNP